MVKNFENVKKKFMKAKKLISNSNLKHLCVSITTNTSLDTKKLHCAPLRQTDDILIFGFILYSTKQLQYITKSLDKSVDIIFGDTEKKNTFQYWRQV